MWKITERASIVFGLLMAAGTLYYTAGLYYHWDQVKAVQPPQIATGNMQFASRNKVINDTMIIMHRLREMAGGKDPIAGLRTIPLSDLPSAKLS